MISDSSTSLSADPSESTLLPLDPEEPPCPPPTNIIARPPFLRDNSFYFETVVFLAENTLFRVPRYGLEADEGVFAGMFSMPQGEKAKEGSSDGNPIILPAQVTAFDFKSFLKASYPQLPGGSTDLTVDEWMSVLKLSDMWEFPKMRTKAIDASENEVQKLGAVEMILLAKKYSVSDWLTKGYDILARRPERITADERKRLGLDTFVRLAEVREKSWNHAVFGPHPYSGYVQQQRNQFGFADAIQVAFEDELMDDDKYRAAHRVDAAKGKKSNGKRK